MNHRNLKPSGISNLIVSAALRFRFRHCSVLHVRFITESSSAFHLLQTRKSLNLGSNQHFGLTINVYRYTYKINENLFDYNNMTAQIKIFVGPGGGCTSMGISAS